MNDPGYRIFIDREYNNRLVLTLPALRNFGIIARYKCLGDNSVFVLPLKALAGQHNPGVELNRFALAIPNGSPAISTALPPPRKSFP